MDLSELWKPLFGLDNCCCAGKKEVEKVIPIPKSADPAEVLPALPQIDVKHHPAIPPKIGSGGRSQASSIVVPQSPSNQEAGMIVPPPQPKDVTMLAAPAAAQKPKEKEGYVSAKQADDDDQVKSLQNPPAGHAPENSPEQAPPANEPAQQMQQKAALQRLVNTFAHDAVRGRPCKFINSRLECCSTEYRLDSSLQYLLVFSSTDHSSVEVQCNVGRIQDIHTYAEDGPNCFHPQIVSNVGNPEDLQNLMMMTYLDRRGEPCSFCLIEASTESRDVFLQSMRVLGIYAQQFVQQPAAMQYALGN